MLLICFWWVFSSFYCGPLSWKSLWFDLLPCTTAGLQARACKGTIRVSSAQRELQFGNFWMINGYNSNFKNIQQKLVNIFFANSKPCFYRYCMKPVKSRLFLLYFKIKDYVKNPISEDTPKNFVSKQINIISYNHNLGKNICSLWHLFLGE